MFKHFQHCDKFLETMTLYQLPDIGADVSEASWQASIASAVSNN